jgi:hypothetical protein
MFIHFDRDKGAECDNCGALGTIMHLSITRSDASLNLCVTCFAAMAQAFQNASRKLRLPDEHAQP